jgi:hypothetical protein
MEASHPLALWLQHHFLHVQILGGFFLLLIGWVFYRPKSPESGFRVREADLRKNQKPSPRNGPDELAQARLKAPLSLTGIRLHGTPHEILGVRMDASESEIQSAYRELIKRYHPDKVGPPDSCEWKDAQKIAEALTQARSAMLARAKKK